MKSKRCINLQRKFTLACFFKTQRVEAVASQNVYIYNYERKFVKELSQCVLKNQQHLHVLYIRILQRLYKG